ncbi:glycohydrolase toxin TNT-related protein [Actinomadura sp. NAK00032]|uniref:glycohydrolase toxin TNT-related protein n=1 Tax=Actinomadura sp. NAK00032 TaxID=2742128 RepID=UPI0015911D32|nr:glycohydrolase toxin TNT-related protein [Actinomadura sp. NAK00032]QKW35094.1 glycohydrolase toxin TNT-related protein [Actinomadura sp. NAK00032]
MARDYDTQLLESVTVRRRRLRDALLFGPQRTRRTFDESVGKIIAGLCAAAVLCAGTVGWSYLQSVLQKQEREKAAQERQPTGGGAAPVPAEWVSTQVTFDRLRKALTEAGVPGSLYVLPGEPRPDARKVSGYYVIAKGKDQFTGGAVEFRQARIAAEFPTEDEACRWLYGELVVQESPPHRLDARAEGKAVRDGAALSTRVRAEIAAAGGASTTYTLPQGTLLDRFGQESGAVLFPYGIRFGVRGQPESARAGGPASYQRYRVRRQFTVAASLSPAAGGSPGGGVRFTVEAGLFPRPPALPTVRLLLRDGYLERVTGTAVPR